MEERGKKAIDNNSKPLVISDPDDDIYYCSYCHVKLIPLPKGLYECPRCVIRFNPDNDTDQRGMRRGTMINTIEGPISVAAPKEVAVSTTPSNLPNPFDRQPAQVRGGLAELQKKGIKITSYQDSGKYE